MPGTPKQSPAAAIAAARVVAFKVAAAAIAAAGDCLGVPRMSTLLGAQILWK